MDLAHLRSAGRLHHRVAVRAPLTIVVAAGLAGCFYTRPINERPRAEITKLTAGAVHYPGEVLQFNASKVSDDGGRLDCVWETFRCDEAGCVRVGDVVTLAPLEVYAVALDGATAAERHARREVQLTVFDGDRALDRATYPIEVGNRAPVVELQARQGDRVTETVVVGVPVEITAVPADPDGDPLTLAWRLSKPRGSAPEVALEELAPDRQRLTPDLDGVWRVEVIASDGFGGEATFDSPLVVQADQAPCVGLTDPPAGAGVYVLGADEPARRFGALTVSDDLDPHPAAVEDLGVPGAARFRWSLRAPSTGDERVALGELGAGVVIDPAQVGAGPVELRLEVDDRVARTPACLDDAPRCEARPGCAQRVTWEVEVR